MCASVDVPHPRPLWMCHTLGCASLLLRLPLATSSIMSEALLHTVSACFSNCGSSFSFTDVGSALQPIESSYFLHNCRRGRALSLKGDYEEAEADFHMAATVDPNCAGDMEKEVVANQHRAKAADRKQRNEMKNFLSRN
eukprot:1143635-Pelagomonas_calceolata.AAC.11